MQMGPGRPRWVLAGCVSRDLTLDAFIKAYQTIGYEPCIRIWGAIANPVPIVEPDLRFLLCSFR